MPPSNGYVKLSENVGFLAVIARDANGCLFFAWVKKVAITSPSMGEALAIRLAMDWDLAIFKGWDKIVCVNAFKRSSAPQWDVSTVVEDFVPVANSLSACNFS